MKKRNPFDLDLKKAKELVYDKFNFEFKNLKWSSENIDYGACTYDLNDTKILYRNSKKTPKKMGQFVTLWKRNLEGITEPFDIQDEIDFIIITARNEDNFGQFIFPKKMLAEKGIITQNGKSGKRGIRIYPTWDKPKSKQAEKTQNWQKKYFLNIDNEGSIDLSLAKKLFSQIH